MNSAQCQSLPTLASILSDTAAPPWTLDKFVEHLVANHSLETLEFIHWSSVYRACYEQLTCTTLSRSTSLAPGHEDLRSLWVGLIDTYIAPNGKREVNLPFDVKTRLLATRQSDNPPSPSMLDSAVSLVYDLMESSLIVSFLSPTIPSKLPEAGRTGRWHRRKLGWTLWWNGVRTLRLRRRLRGLLGQGVGRWKGRSGINREHLTL